MVAVLTYETDLTELYNGILDRRENQNLLIQLYTAINPLKTRAFSQNQGNKKCSKFDNFEYFYTAMNVLNSLTRLYKLVYEVLSCLFASWNQPVLVSCEESWS